LHQIDRAIQYISGNDEHRLTSHSDKTVGQGQSIEKSWAWSSSDCRCFEGPRLVESRCTTSTAYSGHRTCNGL